ncbi:MAG TPA: bacteriohemerythrin [Terriglobales bacterium]
MALVTWDQTYSVKVQSCDSEHQKLFSLINKLHDAMKSGQGRTVLAEIVRELEKYTQTHFLAEEALLQKTQYPRLNDQRLQHQKFVGEVKKFRENLDKGVAGDSISVLTFLKDWLSKHIKQTDTLYSEHLNSHGIH